MAGSTPLPILDDEERRARTRVAPDRASEK
jgi:hypothetical protein